MSDSQVEPQQRLLHLVAGAIVALERERLPESGVYPEVVQRALDSVVLAAIQAGIEPPMSVPALVAWASSAPREWGIGLDLDLPLIDEYTGAPSEACREWDMAVFDPESEVFENEIIKGALQRCGDAEDPAGYTAFRRLLIEQPVLTRAELEDHADRDELWHVRELLDQAYPAAPSAFADDGRFAVCRGCRTLLRPTSRGWACELDKCRMSDLDDVERTIERGSQRDLRLLAAPLRTYVTGPGLVELELEARLLDLGLQVDMWPSFDDYDLRIRFPDGTVWAIDAKDRRDARLLGLSMKRLPRLRDWQCFYLVAPDHRLDLGGNYLARFNAHCAPDVRAELTFCSVTELVKQAKQALRARREH